MTTRSLNKSALTFAVVAVATLALFAGTAQATTMTATADGPATDGLGGQAQHNDWNNAANWDAGIPSGAVDAVVGDGLFAEAWDSTTPVYSGNLTLGTGSTLQVGWTTLLPASINALGGNGGGSGITMNSGSELRLRMSGAAITLAELTIAGNSTIDLSPSTSAHHTTRLVDDVMGAGSLTVVGNNNNTLSMDMSNPSWSGDFVANAVDSWRVEATATGTFGTGDVTINGDPNPLDRGATLQLDAADAIDDLATLALNGGKDHRRSAKLILNAGEEFVGAFIVDGLDLGVGTWNAASGLTTPDGNPLISGGGSITVLPPPPSGTPEPASFALAMLGFAGLLGTRRRRRR